jgi:hypothetical protein
MLAKVLESMKGHMKCFRKIEKDPDEKYDLDKPSGVQEAEIGHWQTAPLYTVMNHQRRQA